MTGTIRIRPGCPTDTAIRDMRRAMAACRLRAIAPTLPLAERQRWCAIGETLAASIRRTRALTERNDAL